MEQLTDYRPVIDKKTKDIFTKCLEEALDNIKLKHIGFIGIIGSFNKKYSHDIDILLFPAKDTKIGAAITEIGSLYAKIENVLKKHHERYYIVPCPKKAMQEMTYYLSTLQEGSAGLIPLHSLFYPNYESFKKFNPADFQRTIKSDLITLYGDFSVIKTQPKIPQKKLEPYFVILDFEITARTTTFPRHLVRTSAESLFSYLSEKYSIKITKKKFHNISEIRNELKNVLNRLDKVTYST